MFRNCQNTLYGVDQLSKKLTTVLVTKIKQELVSDLKYYSSCILFLVIKGLFFLLLIDIVHIVFSVYLLLLYSFINKFVAFRSL